MLEIEPLRDALRSLVSDDETDPADGLPLVVRSPVTVSTPPVGLAEEVWTMLTDALDIDELPDMLRDGEAFGVALGVNRREHEKDPEKESDMEGVEEALRECERVGVKCDVLSVKV